MAAAAGEESKHGISFHIRVHSPDGWENLMKPPFDRWSMAILAPADGMPCKLVFRASGRLHHTVNYWADLGLGDPVAPLLPTRRPTPCRQNGH